MSTSTQATKKQESAVKLIDTLRDLLQQGAVIRAIDPTKDNILIYQGNGIWQGGLDITFPAGDNKKE